MTSVHVLGWTGVAEVSPGVAFFPLSLPLALGPLLYGYIHALTLGRPLDREPLHFLPAAAQFAYLATLLLTPEPLRDAWKEDVHDDLIKPVIEGAVLLSLAAYAVAGLRLLRRYRAWLSRSRSDADLYAGRWIGRVLATLLIAIGLLAGVRLHTWYIGELETGPLQLWLAVWSVWLSVEGWRHTERAPPVMEPEEEDGAVAPPVRDWAELGQSWRQTTQTNGWWREPDLTLRELARRLGTNTAYLSRALNNGLGMNFNSFVNRLRAEEVARRLQADPSASDLLQLAFETGFSSKATFNRAFRAAFGVTPSRYRQRLRS